MKLTAISTAILEARWRFTAAHHRGTYISHRVLHAMSSTFCATPFDLFSVRYVFDSRFRIPTSEFKLQYSFSYTFSPSKLLTFLLFPPSGFLAFQLYLCFALCFEL